LTVSYHSVKTETLYRAIAQ